MFSILLVGCDKNSEETSKDDFVQITIPTIYQVQSGGNTVSGKTQSLQTESEVINVKIINEEGKEVIGKIRLTMPYDDSFTLANLEMTSELLGTGGLTKDFLVDYYSSQTSKNSSTASNQLGCFGDCKTKYKKNEGRGLCKAECWLNILIKVAPIILAIL